MAERVDLDGTEHCTGGWMCPAVAHFHGCHCDDGNCDEPGEHRPAVVPSGAMAERDWGAEAGPLADRIDQQRLKYDTLAGGPPRKGFVVLADLAAAAEGLRLLADLIAAIGDPDNLRLLARTFDLPILARIAAAVPQDPETCACGKPATGTPTCGDDR